jgi:hypothetical protein
MRIKENNPPRRFTVGTGDLKFQMSDCGAIRLDSDEQVTFVTDDGAEYDVARKGWGFYATPSLNGRLSGFGLRGALIRNRKTGRYFVLLVRTGHEQEFEQYCAQETLAVVSWLDSTEALDRLTTALGASEALSPVPNTN